MAFREVRPVSDEVVREAERRKLNIAESLIVASLIGLGTMMFSLRDSVIRMQATQESTNRILTSMQTQLADVPALANRMSRVEVKVESVEDEQREARQTKGLK